MHCFERYATAVMSFNFQFILAYVFGDIFMRGPSSILNPSSTEVIIFQLTYVFVFLKYLLFMFKCD